jgi:hypothetical protein
MKEAYKIICIKCLHRKNARVNILKNINMEKLLSNVKFHKYLMITHYVQVLYSSVGDRKITQNI